MTNSTNQIFSLELLNKYHSKFKLSNTSDLKAKKEVIEQWIKELNSGKLDSLKEEEVKSRFIIDIFGKVLGYKYDHSKKWHLREESKTISNGKKADGTLGYFSFDKSLDDVRAVIEIKEAKTNLDAKQKRKVSNTPVEQAFGYCIDMGDKCNWVIASNFKEIRFYNSQDNSKYQSYYLENLNQDAFLREFILLFHKDRLISLTNKSQTDKLYQASLKPLIIKNKNNHILDEIYFCIKKFDGLGFVDPNYLSTIYPFNVLKKQVWHYDNGELFTINKEIFELINEIKIDENKINFSDKLTAQLSSLKIENVQEKINEIFKFLRKCNIHYLTAVEDYLKIGENRKNTIGHSYLHIFPTSEEESKTINLNLNREIECDCLNCNYNHLDFGKLVSKLKTNQGNIDFYDSEYAYGNYLVASNDYKMSYNIYKYLEKYKYKEDKGIEYFITKFNTKYLNGLIRSYYSEDDREEIIENINHIDLDEVIYNELEYVIDDDVKKYLIQIKENKLLNRVKEEIRKLNSSIDDLKSLYDNRGKQFSGPDLVNSLYQQYLLLYLHINRNFIIQNVFTDYKEITSEMFSGLIQSYKTKEVGLKSFNAFIIVETILNINMDELKRIIKGVNSLKIEGNGINDVIEIVLNFLNSFYEDSSFAFDPIKNDSLSKSCISFPFENKLCRIFSNIFTFLKIIDLTEEHISQIEKPIVSFLKSQTILNHYTLDSFCEFLIEKGNLFKEKHIIEILNIAIDKDCPRYNTYERLVEKTCKTLEKNHPDYRILDTYLIQNAFSNCNTLSSSRSKLRYYIGFSKIANSECQLLIQNIIDNHLDKEFNYDLYEDLLRREIYNYKHKNYFDQYLETVSKMTGGSVKFIEGDYEVFNFSFMNFTMLIHRLEIKLNPNQSNKFKNLIDFEKWLLNPDDFDYKLFKVYWLKPISHSKFFLTKIKNNKYIKTHLENELRSNFNQELSNTYVKYFM